MRKTSSMPIRILEIVKQPQHGGLLFAGETTLASPANGCEGHLALIAHFQDLARREPWCAVHRCPRQSELPEMKKTGPRTYAFKVTLDCPECARSVLVRALRAVAKTAAWVVSVIKLMG
jgi:hypothetical protein